jgi:antitoxin (DNA-binding transcriptional repressor) of toxin-antitoxin stability system
MKTMGVTEFRDHVSREVDLVASSGEGVVLTKRGKPIAQVVPCLPDDMVPVPDRLADTLVFEGDILSPFPADMWEANR